MAMHGCRTENIALMICEQSLVEGIPTPLKNMNSSVWITIPNILENAIHVPVTTNQINMRISMRSLYLVTSHTLEESSSSMTFRSRWSRSSSI